MTEYVKGKVCSNQLLKDIVEELLIADSKGLADAGEGGGTLLFSTSPFADSKFVRLMHCMLKMRNAPTAGHWSGFAESDPELLSFFRWLSNNRYS